MTEDVYTEIIWSIEDLIPFLGIIALCIVIVVLYFRKKHNEIEKRSEIIKTALEKGSGPMPEELLKTFNKPKRSLKERLLSKLLWGMICTFIGLGLVLAVYTKVCEDDAELVYPEVCEDKADFLTLGFVSLAVGAGLVVYYFIARRVLRSEIEKEERMLKTDHEQ
jgi:hypothetical protein